MAKKPRRCKVCAEYFWPAYNATQKVCSLGCAVKDARAKAEADRAKRQRKLKREGRETLKTRSDWHREAHKEVHRFIRLRDHADPCISCGRYHEGQWHAGHYISVAACKGTALRYCEDNIHKQCQPCNEHLSGNIVEYRKGLERKIGPERLAWLEGPHDMVKVTVDEIKAVKAEYLAKANELQKAIDSAACT